METDTAHKDLSYCGVGVNVEHTEDGLIVTHISADSDILYSPLSSLKVGDMITSITENGYTRAIGNGDTLRGPAGSRVSIGFIPAEELDSPIQFERTAFGISRKRFTGDAVNALDADGNTCMQAFVEVEPEALMGLEAPRDFAEMHSSMQCGRG